MISSLTEHTAESNTIFKNLVLQALGTIRIRFPHKKYLKKFHACVPLMICYLDGMERLKVSLILLSL